MLYLELFLTFFKIGLFTIGGGYAMLPLIQADVQAKGWMTAEELVNFIAVSESTPGPFAVNVSTYVGAELAEERLLLRERGSGTRNSVDAGLQGAGATAQPVVESVSTAALLACARAGLGITLLPRSLVVTDLERGDLRELAVEDGGFHRSYFLVRHRSKYLTDGMKRVIRVLREHLGGEQP